MMMIVSFMQKIKNMTKFNHKIYKFYIKFIVRTIRIKLLLCAHLYKKFILFFYIRNIFLPGIAFVRKNLDLDIYQKIERKKLIHEIKLNRFQFRSGPLWFRYIIDKFNFLLQKNKFLFSILFKIFLSIICLFIPIYTFILVRGILPVPDRVPYEEVDLKLKKAVNTRIDYAYVDISSKEEKLKHGKNISVGFLPFRLHTMKGFIVSEHNPLFLKNTLINQIDLNQEPQTLQMNYYLYPKHSGKQSACVLQVFNGHNELLAQNTLITPKIENTSQYSIRNSWRRAFTPNVVPSYGEVYNFKFRVQTSPDQIIVKSFPAGSEQTSSDEHESCQFAFSDISLSHTIKQPLRRRGVVFIVVDGLRPNLAFNKTVMPKLNHFISENSFLFMHHNAQTLDTSSSIQSLLTSKYPSQIDEQTVLHNLPRVVQSLGYRVGMVGDAATEMGLSHEGISNSDFYPGLLTENSRYNGRYVTEMAGQWLKEYGADPFFLYLHYNTLRPPYKPPFEYLDLGKLLTHPFGSNQKQLLYQGVVRYFDDELQLLFQKLADLDILNETDVIITSDYGEPLQSLNDPVDKTNLHVPLIIKQAHALQKKSYKVGSNTAHLDVFPTVYHFMGGHIKERKYQGIDFSKLLFEKNVNSKLLFNRRKNLFFESDEINGIFSTNLNQTPLFYTRGFKKKPQNILFSTDLSKLKDLKQEYFQNSVSDKIFKLTSYFEGKLSFNITFSKPQVNKQTQFFKEKSPTILLKPQSFDVIKTRYKDNSYILKFSGDVKKDDEIVIDFNHSKIKKISFNHSATALSCQDAIRFSEKKLPYALNNNICPFFSIDKSFLSTIEEEFTNPVAIQLMLKNEQKEF